MKLHNYDDIIFEGSVSFTNDPGHIDEYSFRRRGATEDRWYTSSNGTTALSTATLVANRFYAMPFFAGKKLRVDKMAINVTSLHASTARIGIYTEGGNLYPLNLVYGSGALDVGGTGVKSVDLTSSPLDLVPGLYWLALCAGGTPVIRGHAVGSVSPLLGHDNTLGTAPGVGWYANLTYGALPATAPTASATIITAAPMPAIFLRLI